MAQTLGEILQSVATRRANALASLLDQLTGAANAGQTFTATNGQTAFTLTGSANVFMAFLDGAFQVPNIDFTVTGNTFTLTNGALAGQTLYVITLGIIV